MLSDAQVENILVLFLDGRVQHSCTRCGVFMDVQTIDYLAIVCGTCAHTMSVDCKNEIKYLRDFTREELVSITKKRFLIARRIQMDVVNEMRLGEGHVYGVKPDGSFELAPEPTGNSVDQAELESP